MQYLSSGTTELNITFAFRLDLQHLHLRINHEISIFFPQSGQKLPADKGTIFL
jgi:hypothetical protein